MKKYIKAPYTTVGIQGQVLYLGFGSIQQEIADTSKHEILLKILNFFLIPKTWKEANEELGAEPQYESCAKIIKEGHYLIEESIYDREDRFSRAKLHFNMQGIDPVRAHQRLSRVKVGIIGCGGIGNLVSVNLATAGVSKFLLCDNDEVEASNLSRQIMFTESDVGKAKAETLSQALKARASYVEVQVLEKKILSPEDLQPFKEFDLLVVSADKGGVVQVVNKFSAQYRIPYINVGYVNDIAVWGPFVIPGQTGCYSCQNIEAGKGTSEKLNQLMKAVNADYQAPSVGPVNMLASSLASIDIIRFLIGEGPIHTLNKRIGLWTHSLKLETQDCHKNPHCGDCA